ncbi:methyltransferase family protein [Candidatus Omnitrophota bacterium]
MFRQKARFQWGAILGIFLLIFATPSMSVILIGLPIIMLGEIIRFWANGCITKTESLTTFGPYAYVRNPLYLGTNTMMVGFCIISGNLWASLIVMSAYYTIYRRQILAEESDLEKLFQDDYRKYKKHVPRIIPALRRYPFAESKGFRMKKLQRNKEVANASWVLVLLVAFYLYKLKIAPLFYETI